MGPIDLLIVGWCVFLAGVHSFVVPPTAVVGSSVVGYLLVAGGIVLLAATYDRLPGPLRLLRRNYGFFLMPQAFLNICRLSGLLHPVFLDPEFREFERRLFLGVEPAWWMREALPWPWFNEAMHLFYFSYFPIIAGSALALELRSHPALYRLQIRLAVVWIMASLVYIALPVAGPHALRGDDYLQATPFVAVMDYIYAKTHHFGGAFPSSHVAVAWTCWASLRAYDRRYAWVCLPFTLGVTVSTVYCRYHYAIDIFAGMAFSAVGIRLADRLYPLLDPAALLAPRDATAGSRLRSGLASIRRRLGEGRINGE